ncbi:MAG: osmB [Ramlibacter sp.]|nr:osmB [Ramlibacter sp.]
MAPAYIEGTGIPSTHVALRLEFNTRGVQMRSKLFAAALAASLLALGGCASMDRQTVGTVGGAVVGGVIGDAVLGTPGAIAGAIGGGYLGNQAAKK